MTETLENQSTEEKPLARCERCDRETEHYIRFLSPDDEPHNVCWTCLEREEKGFNTNPRWKRERKNWA